MESTVPTPVKLGIKIEKPKEVKIHMIYPLLLTLALVLIGGTAWLLVSEYLGISLAPWFRSYFETLAMMF